MFNSFGNIFRLTSFGESHGKGVGGVIDGFPSGITIDEEFVQQELNRRRPGQSILTTPRKEADKVEFLSGIFEGKSTGCRLRVWVELWLLIVDRITVRENRSVSGWESRRVC